VSLKAGELRDALAGAQHVAIVRLGSIGDVIATLPFAWILREALPAARISWIAHPAPAKLLHGVRAIDEVISLKRSAIPFAIRDYRRALRPARIGAVIDLHGNLKSGVVTRLTGAPVRIGLHPKDCREHWNPLFTSHKLPPLSSGNKTRRALEIGGLLGIENPELRFGLEFSTAENERASSVIGGVAGTGPVAVLQLGRLADVRSWPRDHYRELALGLIARGQRVIILGGPDEMESARALRQILPEKTPGLIYEAGTLSLREVGALCQTLAHAAAGGHFFVGPDSGCLHLAVACGLRTIGLHGPQDPARTAPVGPGFEILYHPEVAPCIPCGRRECFHSVKLACMKSITAAEVIARATGGVPAADASPTATAWPAAAAPDAASGRSGIERIQRDALLLVSALIAFFGSARHPPWGAAWGIPILSATGMTALTYALGKRMGGHRAGLLSGLILLGMWRFLVWSWSPWAGLFGLLSNASLLLYFDGDEDRGFFEVLGIPFAALAAFTAYLCGGPAGLLIPATAALAFHLGEKSPRKLLRLKFLLPAAAAAALTLKWKFDLTLPPGPALESFLAQAFLGALPAAVFLPFALFAHFKTRRYREDLGFADRRWRFPKAVVAGGLLALILWPGRQPEHLLAIYPSLAILIASWWERLWPAWRAADGDC
jgi:lipopolysaccharide heptosyltransferase I